MNIVANAITNRIGKGINLNVSDPLVASTLNSGGNNGGFRTEPGEHLIAHAITAEGHDAGEDGTGRGTPLAIAFQSRLADNGRGAPSEVMYSLTEGAGTGGQTDRRPQVVDMQSRVRRLTPRECERLQGFPDDHTLVPGTSDSARYRQCGNAVAVPVAQWIGERLMKVLRDT